MYSYFDLSLQQVPQGQKPPAAVIYDCDDVLNNARGDNPTIESPFIVEQDGNMGGTIIGIEKIKKVMQFCIEHHIPLYLVTARPDREWHRNFVSGIIAEVGGFHNGVGGFKPQTIHCLGLEQYNEELKRTHVYDLIVTKCERIQEIHAKELSHLPKNRILFVEDSLHHLEPVKKAGYTTIRAEIGNDEHHDKTLNFLTAVVSIPTVATQGNYAVLIKPEQLEQLPLDANEFLEPAETKELKGWYWRKRLVPDLSTLAEIALKIPEQREKIATYLSHLELKQAIFFTNNLDAISKHVMDNSFGTLQSIEDLVSKKLIILVGSESKRKINPLKLALPDANIDLKHVAIIGLPADSGISCQPVGCLEIYSGCKNRLDQILCFEKGLNLLLNKINKKNPNQHRTIISMSIENGIGLHPKELGTERLAITPLTSQNENGRQFHFYDQAHLLFHCNGQTFHKVAKPARIDYVLTSDQLSKLEDYFEDCRDEFPTDRYYLKQSEWSWEMLARIKSANPQSAFPVRQEDDKTLSSDFLIQEALSHFFTYTFWLSIMNAQISLGFFGGKITREITNIKESDRSLVSQPNF